ncbi:SWI/SNF complex subunit SMARCC2 [Fasciolopsis buskii]|uniref:SWI/SNF complex subunit SMARCC2 n=1 Tax=Fasciolopsis buskii TaxID=27845 RepID=A0A8E0S179_9TREM|nr:SWI/SNF complex subunit SMARCC2 [Fasciolopsis buski]
MDFKPGGGLCHIFLACLKFRHEHNWKKIDLSSSSRLEKHLEMLNCVERDLIASKCWERPAVFISPSIEKSLASRLIECTERMGSTVVSSLMEATHVIHPPPSSWPGNNSLDAQHHRFRVIFQEGRGVLLHWLFSPGTYTTWFTGEFFLCC